MVDFDYPQGATPLDPSEIEGLLPTHITTRGELDRWEQDNINEALAWLDSHRPKDILNEAFMKRLHKRMFGNVWRWAGTFRRSDKNIGVSWRMIPNDLKHLCEDVQYMIEDKTMSEDEVAARFHHRLVKIHLFPNGNGRHARLMADILLEKIFEKSPFTWGRENLAQSGDDRTRYIEALQAADKGDYKLLLKFVRS
ncbi:MAG: mobile mystery protein B [Planctomycetota bacterium]|jgi:Fic-DOC domain mobile mystery protein B